MLFLRYAWVRLCDKCWFHMRNVHHVSIEGTGLRVAHALKCFLSFFFN